MEGFRFDLSSRKQGTDQNTAVSHDHSLSLGSPRMQGIAHYQGNVHVRTSKFEMASSQDISGQKTFVIGSLNTLDPFATTLHIQTMPAAFGGGAFWMWQTSARLMNMLWELKLQNGSVQVDYLQPITRYIFGGCGFSLGEQAPSANQFVGVYDDQKSCFGATYSSSIQRPMLNLFHTKKVSSSLYMGAGLELNPISKESSCSVGFLVNPTDYITTKINIDTTGKISSQLEQMISLSQEEAFTVVFYGEIDHGQNESKFGLAIQTSIPQ